MGDFSLVIVAGGAGTRVGSDVKKAFIRLAGTPLLVHTCRAFADNPDIAQRIVVLPADELAALAGRETDAARVAELAGNLEPLPDLRKLGVDLLVAGGPRRQDSLLNGLRHAVGEFVMVHDAARPFVTPDDLAALAAKTRETGAAILAHPVRDTIKRVSGEGITETVDRADLWAAQTPQAFRRETLLKAFANHGERDVTDDAALVALDGVPCAVVRGSALNFKITTPEDLRLAEALLHAR